MQPLSLVALLLDPQIYLGLKLSVVYKVFLSKRCSAHTHTHMPAQFSGST